MPSKSVPSQVPYGCLTLRGVNVQTSKVFTVNSKWSCQAGAWARDHAGRKGSPLRNPVWWIGASYRSFPGLTRQWPSFTCVLPPTTHPWTSSPCHCCDLVQALLSLNFPESGACVGLYYCWLAVGRHHLYSQPASIQQPSILQQLGGRMETREWTHSYIRPWGLFYILHVPVYWTAHVEAPPISHQEHTLPQHSSKEEKVRSLGPRLRIWG